VTDGCSICPQFGFSVKLGCPVGGVLFLDLVADPGKGNWYGYGGFCRGSLFGEYIGFIIAGYCSVSGDPVDRDGGVSIVYVYGNLMDKPSYFLSVALGQVYCLGYCCLVVCEYVDLVAAESVLA
jgi:hypothetical protein